ncbi:D-glycero-beta-D-manno-heptose-7-phosphate kinase [Putridiphycobacter roseus]|uniref:D-glycero-beta-D-manno-heptose-7-phosphate kinase n=1 Tax=Putridiphycobacter roseus TaxID=2219161 RepID=A0A2W1NEZ8_9FLAO|nr:bifunctional ADP-heptose synthase [Putridiphycobacter roseus]PZE18045.1 D-glycero-beta-D-manno-heptose-7-phosphate kinase [Putridiphycobacter roseus]
MNEIKRAFKNFSAKKIIVLGDVMVDTYIHGKVNRISPEAPVPVVNFDSRTYHLGGAANVALNIKALGATPYICSFIGNDESGALFEKLMTEKNLSNKGILYSDERITSVKTRIIGNNQQLLRIDQEQTDDINSVMTYNLVEKIKEIVKSEGIDAIIFEDYNKGILTTPLIEQVIAFANEHDIVTSVDPKLKNFLAYKNVTLFKPNLKELKSGLLTDFKYPQEKDLFLAAVENLNQQLNCQYTFITLSENGVYMKYKEKDYFIPAHLRNIADVSGAGDTVISVATLCIISGLEPYHTAEIANLAGGLVCEKVGVISVDKEQLLNEAIKTIN